MKIYALAAVFVDCSTAVVYKHEVYDNLTEVTHYLDTEIKTCDWWPSIHKHYTFHIIEIDTEEVEDG